MGAETSVLEACVVRSMSCKLLASAFFVKFSSCVAYNLTNYIYCLLSFRKQIKVGEKFLWMSNQTVGL